MNFQKMFLYLFIFLLCHVSGSPSSQPTTQPSEQPTAQPNQNSLPGGLCSEMQTCDGFCVGPFFYQSGIKIGVCSPFKVGRRCIKACLETEQKPCMYFPGNCLICLKDQKKKSIPEEGICL
jgi:hypothetical protein